MKSKNQLIILSVGLVLALMSPIGGVMILDEDKTNKIDGMIVTFIPMSIGASMMFYTLYVNSNEEKSVIKKGWVE